MSGKPQSLAAQSGALQMSSLTLPSVFSAVPEKPMEGRDFGTYVTFCHMKRSDEWQKLMTKFGALNEGDMYLIQPKVDPIKLDTMKCSMLCGKQAWVRMNQGGTELLEASFEEKPNFKEQIETVLLVYLEDKIVPANCTFKTTKCGAGITLDKALAEASRPTWLDKSPAHKETGICTQPFMRFFGLVTVQPPRPSKTTGIPYRPTSCAIQPTTLNEWRLLKALTEAPDTKKLLDQAAQRYQSRLAELTRKVPK